MSETTQPEFVLLAGGAARHTLMPDIHGWLRTHRLRERDIQIEPAGEQIYLRLAVTGDSPLDTIHAGFVPVGEEHGLSWTLRDITAQRRIAVLVSTKDHCLADLLARWRHKNLAGDIDAEIGIVVSNHPEVADLVSSYGIEFRYIPVGEDKAAAELELLGALAGYRPHFVVMARYQQILSKDLCELYKGKLFNLHPSLLPAFPGANAYQQAADAGVKVIGATFHVATAELDEGPIIGQQTRSVAHLPVPDAKAYARLGRSAEIAALAEGMRLLLQDKVFIDGDRVVTFT